MNYIKEFNIFDTIPEQENPIIAEIVELFIDKVDKFLEFDPDWLEHKYGYKSTLISSALENLYNRYFVDEDADTEVLDSFLNNKDTIINKIVLKLDQNFY